MNTDVYVPKHTHKWFMAQTKKDFEPGVDNMGDPIYRMVEYAYLVCYCGQVEKTVVGTRKD